MRERGGRSFLTAYLRPESSLLYFGEFKAKFITLVYFSSTFHSFLTLGYGILSFSLSRSTCPFIPTNPGSPSSTVTEAWLFPLASSLELSSESVSSSGPSSFHILEMLKRIPVATIFWLNIKLVLMAFSYQHLSSLGSYESS